MCVPLGFLHVGARSHNTPRSTQVGSGPLVCDRCTEQLDMEMDMDIDTLVLVLVVAGRTLRWRSKRSTIPPQENFVAD